MPNQANIRIAYDVTTNNGRVYVVTVTVKHQRDINRAISCGFADAVRQAHETWGSPLGQPYEPNGRHVASVAFRSVEGWTNLPPSKDYARRSR